MPGVEEYLQQALALGDEGRFPEMANILEDALEQAPDDPYVLCWLGVAQQEMGNDGAAYELFRRCIAQDVIDPNLLALAGAGMAAFDDPEAEAVLRSAALSGPDVPMARLQYGSYLARAGLYDEAMEHLQAARELTPEDPVVQGELGVAHALKGDFASAVSAFETALELAPDDSWTRLLLGLVYIELGSLEEAAEALVQGAEEREEDAEAHLLAALSAAAVGWDDAAQAALVRAENTEGVDTALWEEAEDRILRGQVEAQEMLVETLAPSALRERLAHPL